MTDDIDLEARIMRAVARVFDPYAKQVDEVVEAAKRAARYADDDRRRADEDRKRLAADLKSDTERQSEEVAEKVANRILKGLGIDPEKADEFRKRKQRSDDYFDTLDGVKKYGLFTITAGVIVGAMGMLWKGFVSGVVKP